LSQAAEALPRPQLERPRLVFFHSSRSGACRRVEGYIAQVLQRRRNHDTFTLVKVEADERPEIVQRFKIDTLPTVVVVEGKRVAARLVMPRGCKELERFLAPWLN
jgi:thioredoxin-like negative regulator of GroEL